MTTVRVEAQLSAEELLKAVKQLSPADLEQLIRAALVLLAQQKAANLEPTEAELLLKINQGVPADLQTRYDELIAKRKLETLTTEEYSELLKLTEQVEKLEAQRIEWLAELARVRAISLTQLMDDLGIRKPEYV
jgi:hypothetical protein